MRSGRKWSFLAVGWLLVTGVVGLRADEPPPWHPCRLREWPGRLYYGRGGPPHTFDRAGHPDEISHFARPSDNPRYFGYYVGGGSPCRGRGPEQPAEGTWGWDYGGLFCWFKPHIELLWAGRYQGGIGAYKIDGPPVKDVGPYVEKVKEGECTIHIIKHGHE
jgi:hypothetical protein